jgi:nucleotide-binding universal stress UspA family protein
VHLVAGHDGHPAADAALAVAVDLATRLGAQLHVVHSITVEDYGVDPDSEEFEDQHERNVAQERETIERALADTGVQWTYHEEHGDPAARLAALADQLDALLIVVGSTHRGMFHQLTARSVPRRLVQMQRRPVVVVPEPQVSSRSADG